MLTKTYKYSKNKVHEFSHEADINHQYFENLRLITLDFKSHLPHIKQQILQPLNFFKPWTDYFHQSYFIYFSGMLGIGLGFYFHISTLWVILSIGLYFITHLFLNSYESFIEAKFQNIYHEIQEAEKLYQIGITNISHLGLDSAIILQRICNQNSQFANYLKYYHQSEEMLKYHRQDLDDLSRHLKKDYQNIAQENIEEKLELLKKFNQELSKQISSVETLSEKGECSNFTKSLIEKSMFYLEKHQGISAAVELTLGT